MKSIKSCCCIPDFDKRKGAAQEGWNLPPPRSEIALHTTITIDGLWRASNAVVSLLNRPGMLYGRGHAAEQRWAKAVWFTRAPAILRKLVAHATVFHLWKQSNNILHNKCSIPPSTLFGILDKDIKNIISSRRHGKGFESIMQLWLH
ncbi:unnamed protein product [Microthlaspi erraticum]|uniref:Reverse transcriptase zinc-binding domain-containing protein n=1 Tax=Microthlaspi erraticum TaxID=1685480 RepID=A0A6D2HPV8_9BRAS|nr:unnamed protein product [Microthlaspi erraticum]